MINEPPAVKNFWSLKIEICDFFVIWCLELRILKFVLNEFDSSM